MNKPTVFAVAVSLLTACGSKQSPSDGGTDGGSDGGVTVNGCTESLYVDRSASQADRTVGFGGARGSPAEGYAPACITIAAGQSVTFEGIFDEHPLSPGVVQGTETPGNPITLHTSGTAAFTVAFPAAGTFGFQCLIHTPSMAGAVRVK